MCSAVIWTRTACWNSRALIRNSILPSPLHITPKPVWCVPWKNWASDAPGNAGIAPTITTILARRYIAKENRNLYVTELGEVVNNMMKEAFPSIVDVNFTANMEALLDGVEEGTVKWKTIVSNFYPDLDEAVKKAEKDLAEVTIADEESDEVCELCGRRMVIKYGPHGRFLACPGFPECRNTKPYFEKIGVACPKCGKDIVMKKTKKGRKYYGCIDNPECDFMVWQKPSGEKCPRCGKLLLEKGNKLVCMDEQCGYVKNKPTEEK